MTLPLTRRAVIGGGAAFGLASLAAPALAVTREAATRLVDGIVGEVNAVIASGASEAQMLVAFEGIFDRYADVPTIAAYVLGPDRRRASAAQLAAFTDAYKTYVAHKYGRRFREFIGGVVEVVTARDLPRGVEVETTVRLRGQSPMRVDFHVEDSRGRPLFFNLIVEGVNMLLSERTEVQAMLDARRGDLDALVGDIVRAS